MRRTVRMKLSVQTGTEMPICESVYEVLHCGADVHGIIGKLMNREPKAESGSMWG